MSDHNLLDSNTLAGEAAGVVRRASAARRSRRRGDGDRLAYAPPAPERASNGGALPLRGLDAWRVYFGLPLSGSRLPPAVSIEFFALGSADADLKLYGPTVQQAVAQFPPALAELRRLPE